MPVKLYEIAKAAGVSISTVSSVLNNDTLKPASKTTEEKVMQIATDLGYFAGHTVTPATQKSTGERRNLACLLASASDTFNYVFFSKIMVGIQEEALGLNYLVSHTLSGVDTNIESICTQIRAANSDGVILMGRVRKDVMDAVKSITPNIVYAGLNRPDAGIDEVICDAYSAISESVDYLLSLGHRKIGFIGSIPSESSDVLNEHRFAAFSDTMQKHGLPVYAEYCKNITLSTEQAYHATAELVETGTLPEAFCCANDNVAIGVISALTERGIRVPNDISVIGIDNIEPARFMYPRLTSFEMQNEELGRFAVKILNDRILGKHDIPISLRLPCTLIVRDSCRVRTMDSNA